MMFVVSQDLLGAVLCSLSSACSKDGEQIQQKFSV